MIYNDYLEHHGVLGQKWGVRRFQNADGSLTPKGKKRKEKEFSKEVQKRNRDIFVKSNNDAANKINGKWLDDFNSKWGKKFEDGKPWNEQEPYNAYIKDYTKWLVKFMDESVRSNPNASFTTFDGEKYSARFLEEYGQQAIWASEKEWKAYNKQ